MVFLKDGTAEQPRDNSMVETVATNKKKKDTRGIK